MNGILIDGKVIGGFVYLYREVLATGVSPMNPKVKWAKLACGHDVYLRRKPRVGSKVVCTLCREAAH